MPNLESPPPILTGNLRRRNYGWLLRDILLLPPALLYVIVEEVFWRGAKTLLRQAARVPAIAALQHRVERLPAWAVLPLFLVPEVFSHIGGFWASYLLVRRAWVAALLVGIFIKGTATLAEVWIYLSCEPTLLSVRWFAWVHGQFRRGREWVAARMRPVLELVRGRGSGVARRFVAIRRVIRARMKK
jgi:hypothetical protein